MGIVKSFYIPMVPVHLTKLDFINRFRSFGVIHSVDFGNLNFEETKGDVFVHFSEYDEFGEGRFMNHSHKQQRDTYIRLDTEEQERIRVLPYISKQKLQILNRMEKRHLINKIRMLESQLSCDYV